MLITPFISACVFVLLLAIPVALSAENPVEASTELFSLSSPAFAHNTAIPKHFTCSGADVNPPLEIHNIPEGTKAMALTVHDPDGIIGTWVHWVVYNIKPGTVSIPENSTPGQEALNDFGNFYYGGPCPPNEKPHQYIFTLYALNTYLDDVTEGATKDTLEKAMTGKIIAKTELTGTYQNPRWAK